MWGNGGGPVKWLLKLRHCCHLYPYRGHISEWKGCEVEELNVQEDHIHLMVSIPPKVSVSVLMGTLKGKLAIKLFKSYPGLKKKPYLGNHFWARGYFVSTIGLDEDVIRRYVKYQENEERKEENQRRAFRLFEST